MIDLVRKILRVFDKHGLWDQGIELIGSWCFVLYQKHFGVRQFPFRTPDIDFLVPVPYKGKKKIDLFNLLEPLGFKTGFNSDGSMYLWNAELKIEFIVPERGKGTDGPKYVEKLLLKAVPLRFMDMLLKDPVQIEDRGIKILVPNPVAFAVHKLLISARRKNKAKKLKDLEQALLVLDAVDAKKVKELFVSLPKPWRKIILKVLNDDSYLLPLRKHIADQVYAALIP